MCVSSHPRYHLKAVTNHSELIYLLKPSFGNLDKREEMGSYCLELETGAEQGHIGQIDHCVNFQDAKQSPSLSHPGAGALLGWSLGKMFSQKTPPAPLPPWHPCFVYSNCRF